MSRRLLPNAAPKPKRKAKPAPRYSSIQRPSWERVCLELAKARAKRKPVKRKNAKRAAANHERAYGSHADFIRSLPCCVCGYRGPAVEAAHTTTGGMGKKADAKTLIPLCGPTVGREICGAGSTVAHHEGCHRELHRIGCKSFEQKYSVDLKSIAENLFGERAE